MIFPPSPSSETAHTISMEMQTRRKAACNAKNAEFGWQKWL